MAGKRHYTFIISIILAALFTNVICFAKAEENSEIELEEWIIAHSVNGEWGELSVDNWIEYFIEPDPAFTLKETICDSNDKEIVDDLDFILSNIKPVDQNIPLGDKLCLRLIDAVFTDHCIGISTEVAAMDEGITVLPYEAIDRAYTVHVSHAVIDESFYFVNIYAAIKVDDEYVTVSSYPDIAVDDTRTKYHTHEIFFPDRFWIWSDDYKSRRFGKLPADKIVLEVFVDVYQVQNDNDIVEIEHETVSVPLSRVIK